MYRKSRILFIALMVSATHTLLFTAGCNYSEEGRPSAEPTFATTQIRTFSVTRVLTLLRAEGLT
jgi:hypothetical protein